ncbi:MAG: pyruvate:ferredoxin (flavodoxin) oxidoreductase [Candidatus Thermoplasmatota archaeon]|jgi:pyruvate-ferredoxin/flavodoxin oxidoreductase|nr:pyruvate:ferredoxin (flavodoxin) oxidoreductase [Candidatus Thermoplasmatota archaeon]
MAKKSIDGNTAAAHVAYAFSDVAAIYPITPSSPMGEIADEWAAYGRKNIFGQVLKVAEMQSEGGAAGAIHGSLAAGAFTTTFTASQGLMLMLPNMCKISGELMPAVFHIAARSLAMEVLSIFGDHSDVMAARPSGFAEICSSSIQEIMDIGLVAHLSTLRASIPFLHFFEGFRSSHEIQKIDEISYEDMAKMADQEAIRKFRARALNPEHPHMRMGAMGPDTYFQVRERSNEFYDRVPQIVQEEMDRVAALTGRQYHLFDYMGHPEAERVIICMGAGSTTTEEVVDHLAARGEKVGVVNVRLYRPFSGDDFYKAVPKTARKIAVLDRTKEPGAYAEPLFEDVCTVFQQKGDNRKIVGGRYGLSSKQFTATMAKTVFDNLKLDEPKNHFTIGITDDITHTSLTLSEKIDTEPDSIVRCKFWGIGGDGTVGANKNAIKIIGDNTDKYAQGYFEYDAKKSGGVTRSHLRFGDVPIKARYLVDTADYIAVHNSSYVEKYDILEGIKEGGIFVLNSHWDLDEMEQRFPGQLKRMIAANKLQFYNIDAEAIAMEVGLGQRINMVMQTTFFKLANILPVEEAVTLLKKAIEKTYKRKGDEVVKMNYRAVDIALDRIQKIEYPQSWKDAPDEPVVVDENRPEFIRRIVDTMSSLKGDTLKTSDFEPSGFFPSGTSKYEKRGTAVNVPRWIAENCIQCNQCAFVCPHASIRPFLVTGEEAEKAPEGYKGLRAVGKDLGDYEFTIQVSVLDCQGCGNCADVCPGRKGEKALEMKTLESQKEVKAPLWDYMDTLPVRHGNTNKYSIKGSQFRRPLLEFNGACAGCGETPYVKAITQLYGDRMIIANATGCTSIWAAYAPSAAYCKNELGHGPAWANSLFEDNAEYGFGMYLATSARRDRLANYVRKAIVGKKVGGEFKDLLVNWLDVMHIGDDCKPVSLKIQKFLKERSDDENLGGMFDEKDMFTKPSHWIIGGDGWAYDIGYGGLDHVLAMGEDVNVLVVDTEVYSNTGGQSSKATPIGSVAKFATSGKKTTKKDLGLMVMTYGYVYVASVSMGANKNQFLKAIREAESYPGPALVIAYAPCINHGIKAGGMGKSQEEMKKAVDAGYWFLYRYDPRLKAEGKNPFQLDSKEPSESIRDFLMGEVRYHTLTLSFPDEAKKLHDALEEDQKLRYQKYKRMSD